MRKGDNRFGSGAVSRFQSQILIKRNHLGVSAHSTSSVNDVGLTKNASSRYTLAAIKRTAGNFRNSAKKVTLDGEFPSDSFAINLHGR